MGKMFGRAVLSLLLLALCLPLGCGRKAPPRPPRPAEPPVVGDLRETVEGDRLRLSWSLPGGKVAAFGVYRARIKTAEDDCPRCPLLFERVARIPADSSAENAAGVLSAVYDETLEKGYRYFYKVTVLADGDAAGGDSNIVEFRH